MPIVATDILLRLAGGSSNTVPDSSLGGVMSTSTVIVDNTLHNLFDVVSGTESTAGDTEYRSFYVLNNHGTLAYQNAKIWINSETTHTNENVQISLAGEGANTTMETIANENTAPVSGGLSFQEAATEGAALSLGTLNAGQRYGIWVKRITTAGCLAKDNYTVVINVKGDTSE